MAINTLTDADCRKATPDAGKLRKLFDGHGLLLAVLPGGNKVWRLAFRSCLSGAAARLRADPDQR